jgi:ftsJ-like methyltransferase
MKIRLDNLLVDRKMVESRSQAESYIKLGKVTVDGIKRTKPGFFVDVNSELKILQQVQYVSRAGLKLESVAKKMRIDFRNKTVLDVGSSTGGFTDYSLKNGANKVISVDVGTDQLHPKLRLNKKVELHEKTDIRNFKTNQKIDVVVIDVSFISIKEILPSVVNLSNKNTKIVAMVKPQFEAGRNGTVNGVVKNNYYRRKILQDFENWCRSNNLYIENKRDSEVKGTKGNQERFYILKKMGR